MVEQFKIPQRHLMEVLPVIEMLKQLGGGLRSYFRGEVRRPLNWRMIDAIETLKEAESSRSNDGDRDGKKPEKDETAR